MWFCLWLFLLRLRKLVEWCNLENSCPMVTLFLWQGENRHCTALMVTVQLQAVFLSLTFSSVQFKMVSMRSEKPTCALSRLSEVSPTLPLRRFQCSSDCMTMALFSSFEGRSSSASSFHASLLQAVDDVMLYLRGFNIIIPITLIQCGLPDKYKPTCISIL